MKFNELKDIAQPHIRKGQNLPSNSFLLLTQLHIQYKTKSQCESDFEGINPLYNTPAILYSDRDDNKTIYFNSNTRYWNFYIFHEIAHYLLGHEDDSPQNEIDADMLACILAAPEENLPSNIRSAKDISSLCQIPIDKAEMYWQEIKSRRKRPIVPITLCALSALLIVIICVCVLPLPSKDIDTPTEAYENIEQSTPEQNTNPDSQTTVYITSSGKKFHLPFCRYIKNKTGIIECSMSEAIKEGYTPCKICIGEQAKDR